MEHRFLGQTGVKVSRLSFGAMSFGDGADEAEARRMFTRCLDAGINHFDTADVYTKGASEEMLGRAIAAAGCRDRVVVATKGYFVTGADENAKGSSRYHLVRAVEASLRRLGTDRIDIYYLHRFDDETAVEETVRALEDLVRAGKILYPAASNFSAWQVEKSLWVAERLGAQPLVCVQPMFNLVKRQAEVEILPMCRAEKIGVVTYGPTGGGLLTGRYGVDRRPDSGRLVDNKMYGVRYQAASYYEIAGRFTELARARGVHPAALAVAWVASHPAVTSVLLGARNVEQLEPLLGALDVDISEELKAELDVISPPPPPATDRNEEGSASNYGRR